MKLLDLFCGAGGASRGYAHQFSSIVGVDIFKQGHYPFTFIQDDAFRFPLDGFDLIHASPPCQDHSMTRFMFNEPHGTGWMLEAILLKLQQSGTHYVVENVPTAKAPGRCYDLCAASMGHVSVPNQLYLRKHRRFWVSWDMDVPPCTCKQYKAMGFTPAIVYGVRRKAGLWVRTSADDYRSVMHMPGPLDDLRRSIPPGMTRFIAHSFTNCRRSQFPT